MIAQRLDLRRHQRSPGEENEPLLPRSSACCEQVAYAGDGTVWPLFSQLLLKSVNPDEFVMRGLSGCQRTCLVCVSSLSFHVSCLVF